MSYADFGSPDTNISYGYSNNTNQSNFEVSEFFEFGDWMDEDQTTFMVSGYSQTPNPAVSGAVENSSQLLLQQQHHEPEGQTSSKQKKNLILF